jgi:PTS system galactitol-specific IIA component
LPTAPIGVAIPHADPDHVIRTAVCVGILRSPVTFAQMGTDSSKTVQALVIFMLAVKEKEKQVVMIQQLVQLIQNPDLLEALTETKDAAQASALIKKGLAD